ncbi:MAG: hypothetical protein K2L86_06755 [Lachnospiraceae bacterium]|nr:hypothetical protein [Lachnospiraceae bacterium]
MSEQIFEQQMKKLRRDLAFTRGMCIITSILTLLLICGGGYLFLRMQGVLENAQPILEQVAEVDMENVNETLWQIRTTLETVDLDHVVATMEQAVETLDELDIDALNSAIEGLDTTELSEALTNLNDAVESLQRVEDSIGSVFGR